MKKKKNVFSMGFLGKFVLLVALFVGGGMSVWAEDYVATLTFNNSIPSGWINGGKYGNTTAYSVFNINSDNIETANNYGTFSLTSSSTSISISPGQKIIISAKVKSTYNSTGQHVTIRYATNNSENAEKDSYSQLVKFTSKDFSSKDEYISLEHTVTGQNMTNGCRLQFLAQAAVINRIEILSALSELTVIDEGTDPGEFKSNTPSSLTVKYTANAGWNTICMPFNLRTHSVNHMPEIFGTDWKAYTLENYNNGILTFSPVASSGYLNANTPLLVYAPNATGSQTELNLTDEAVTYSASPSTTVDGATFHGTYAPMSMEGKYGVTSSGQVMQGTETADIKGYRAYFTGITPPAGGAARPTIVFEDDKEAQGLSAVMWMENTKEAYNLQGQKVEKGRKGIYIVNGRKVVIK